VQAIRLLVDYRAHLPCVPLYRGDQPATGPQLLEQGRWRLLAAPVEHVYQPGRPGNLAGQRGTIPRSQAGLQEAMP